MALYRCGSSGGTAEIVEGSGTYSTTNTTYTIPLGFKPRALLLIFSKNESFTDISHVNTYLEDWDSSKHIYSNIYNDAASIGALPNTTALHINSITNTGFTFKTYSNTNYKYVKWYALK